jgi:hypothetical protein
VVVVVEVVVPEVPEEDTPKVVRMAEAVVASLPPGIAAGARL